jgi:hypothetical protein
MNNVPATRHGMEVYKKPVTDVLADLLHAGNTDLQNEIILQLDLYIHTLNAAMYDRMSFSIPAAEGVELSMLGHSMTTWRPPMIRSIELDLTCSGPTRSGRTLMETLEAINDLSFTQRMDLCVNSREQNFYYHGRHDQQGGITFFEGPAFERQAALLMLMVEVDEDRYRKIRMIANNEVQPVTPIERKLQEVCCYLAEFYEWVLNGGGRKWRDDPFAEGSTLGIGNQGMEIQRGW